MLGALIGDMIGSRFEWHNYKRKDFELCHDDCRATDDSVLTIAVADVLLNDGHYAQAYRQYYRRYPNAGYGGGFASWASGESMVGYNSYGNGSAMRVSPVGWYEQTLEGVLQQAQQSAIVTHSHPEGIRGAQAVASAIFLARHGKSKEQIKGYIEQTFRYALVRTPDEIRPAYQFDVTCQGSVPEALCCFLHSTDFEDAIRTAVSIGGDSDTIACITGSIAEAFYGGAPSALVAWCLDKLNPELRQIVSKFCRIYGAVESD